MAQNARRVAELAASFWAPVSSEVMRGEAPLVLLVEDDPATRQFYTIALERDGFRVDQAHNGHQALEKAFSTSPDLVVTDIAIPGLDGIELCRRLRADGRTRAIPLLAVTGYDDRQYPDRATIAGADSVLIKPFGAERIVAEARRLLSLPTHPHVHPAVS